MYNSGVINLMWEGNLGHDMPLHGMWSVSACHCPCLPYCSPPLLLAMCLAASLSERLLRKSSLQREGCTCSTRTCRRLRITRVPTCTTRQRQDTTLHMTWHGMTQHDRTAQHDMTLHNMACGQACTHLLVDLHTDGALGDVPHDAGLALVPFVGHALGGGGSV